MLGEVDVGSFEAFFERAEPLLRDALSASLGSQLGREMALDGLSYAWENWARVRVMDNPVGYLYVLARGRGRRARWHRRTPMLMPVDSERTPWVEPSLPDALAGLAERQRVVVVLVYCFEWTLTEVAELLQVSKSTAQSHADRGMAKLREQMGVAL